MRDRISSRLKMSHGKYLGSTSDKLKDIKKLRARYQGDLDGALISGAYYAKKFGDIMYVYSGNSYGSSVWRVSQDKSEYLSPINNTGKKMFSVTPECDVYEHELSGGLDEPKPKPKSKKEKLPKVEWQRVNLAGGEDVLVIRYGDSRYIGLPEEEGKKSSILFDIGDMKKMKMVKEGLMKEEAIRWLYERGSE